MIGLQYFLAGYGDRTMDLLSRRNHYSIKYSILVILYHYTDFIAIMSIMYYILFYNCPCVLSLGWLWADYGLPMGWVLTGYWLSISWLFADYQQAIGLLLACYWLAIG